MLVPPLPLSAKVMEQDNFVIPGGVYFVNMVNLCVLALVIMSLDGNL